MSAFPQNLGVGLSPQVWLCSSHLNYQMPRLLGYAPWLDPVQKAQLEQIRQARMLFDGRHDEFYIYEGRTVFDFPVRMANGREVRRFVPYNLLKLISLKSADLLFGNDPTLSVEDELQQAALADLVDRNHLHEMLICLAVECSCDGRSYVETCIQNGQVWLRRIDAADIFPVGKIQPGGQYTEYVKWNAMNVGSDSSPDWRLLETRYLPGRIVRRVRQLNAQGVLLPHTLTMNQWPQEDPDAAPPEPETITGIADNTITFIPNLLIREIPVSDYDGLIEAQDAVNAAESQLDDVIAAGLDPILAAPARSADDKGRMRIANKVHYFDNVDEIPRYITWQAELDAAMENRDKNIMKLCVLAEMSPVLLGIKFKGSGAEKANAYKSLKLEATNSLSKAARKAVLWRGALRRIFGLVGALMNTLPGTRFEWGPVGVEMSDGLPDDADAKAQEASLYRAAGGMSVYDLVESRKGKNNVQAIKKEIDRLAAEAEGKTPSIIVGTRGPEALPSGASETEETDTEIAA